MPFKRGASPTYFAPAEFNVLDADGKLAKQLFDIQCKRLKKSELEQLDVDIKAWAEERRANKEPGNSDRKIIERVIVGWRAVQAPDGSELPYSIEAVDQVEEEFPGFMAACVRAFYMSTMPGQAAHLAAAKN